MTIGWVLDKNSKRSSGAGTILGQGGQGRERQSRERKIKFFAEIGVSFCPKNKCSLKKKEVFAGLGVSFCPKNKRSLKTEKKKKVFAGLGVSFCPKNNRSLKKRSLSD